MSPRLSRPAAARLRPSVALAAVVIEVAEQPPGGTACVHGADRLNGLAAESARPDYYQVAASCPDHRTVAADLEIDPDWLMLVRTAETTWSCSASVIWWKSGRMSD